MEVQCLFQYSKKVKNESTDLKRIMIPLLGEFKGGHGEKVHLLMIADTIASGFKLQQWHDQVVALLKMEGRKRGPCDV